MQEASTSGTKKDVIHTPSSSTSPIASTSTANATSQGNEQPKRKSIADDEEICETKRNKFIKFDHAEQRKEFDSLLSNFNKDVTNESDREEIFKIIRHNYFKFYIQSEKYLVDNWTTLTPIEEDNRKLKYHVCNKCGRKYKTITVYLVKHILITHQMEWPKEVKMDSRSEITALINKKTSEADAELEPVEKLKNNVEIVEITHEIISSNEVSTTSEDVLLIAELEKCYNIVNSSFSITKEMLESQKSFIRKLKSSSDFMNDLIWDAKKSNFCIILNKYLSANDKTFLSLIIMYFSNDKICSHLYRFIEVKSEDFLIDVKNQMKMDGLNIDRFVGFGYEITEMRDSIIESTLSDLQKIKKHLDLKTELNIIINKHIYEPVRAIVEGAHEYISRDVEFLLKETYMWFKSHKGQTITTSLEEKILKSIPEENKEDICMFKLDLVYVVMNNWTELKEHFRKMKNPCVRWRIHGLYENNVNEMYLKLIYNSLIHFKNFFEFLNYSLVTKDRWTEKLEKVSNELKALATVRSEVPEQPITHFQNFQDNKKEFLNSLESAIDKFLKNNNSSTPTTIPISNETTKKIISCIYQSINNFKDDFSTETAELLQTCIQIKFMKANE